MRTIWVIALGALALVGGLVWAGNRDQVQPPPPAPISFEKTFAVLGDSYTEGAGAGWESGWVNRISDEMCWTLVKVSAQGGTGFVAARADAGSATFPQRVEQVTTPRPGIVLVQGGLNDLTAATEEIHAAALATFSDLASRVGDATIVAIGPAVTPNVDPAEVARVASAIEAAALESGVHFLDPAKERWVEDPRLFVDDGYHLNPAGYQEYARRLAEGLERDGLEASCR